MPLFILTRLAINPLFYHYIVQITLGKRFRKLDYVHYLPAVVFMVAFIVMHLMVSHNGNGYEGEYRPNFLNGKSQNDKFFFLLRTVFILQIVFYMFRSFQLIRQYKNRINNLYSNLQDFESGRYSLDFISEQCGFGSLSNFVRVFHSFENMAPGQYRENHLSNLANPGKES